MHSLPSYTRLKSYNFYAFIALPFDLKTAQEDQDEMFAIIPIYKAFWRKKSTFNSHHSM